MEIARRLRCHRNTVRRWREDPHFQRRLTTEVARTTTTTRYRRLKETTTLANRFASLTRHALKELAQKPDDEELRRRAFEFADGYRRTISAERLLLQDVTQMQQEAASVRGSPSQSEASWRFERLRAQSRTGT
jgi:hypothetical protein